MLLRQLWNDASGLGDVRSSQIVDRIANEEKAHVAVGVAWFTRLCFALGSEPGAVFRGWLNALCPELLKGPFNHDARREVGLQEDWYDKDQWPSAGHVGPGMDLCQLQALHRRLEHLLHIELTNTQM